MLTLILINWQLCWLKLRINRKYMPLYNDEVEDNIFNICIFFKIFSWFCGILYV